MLIALEVDSTICGVRIWERERMYR